MLPKMSAPEQNSPLLNLITDCLRFIISYVDQASMVSMALTSKFFTFDRPDYEKDWPDIKDDLLESDHPDDKKPLLPLYIPDVYGIGVVLKCVKYNYLDLFDYWAPLVHIENYSHYSVGKMMKYAGKLTPRSTSQFWIMKIQAFLYSRPLLAERTLFWREYTQGVIKTDNVEHYIATFPTVADPDNHFKLATLAGAIRIAEHIVSINPDDDFFEPGYQNEVGKSSPAFVIWYLDNLAKRENLDHRMLGMLLAGCEREENAKIILSHPRFSAVNDADITIHGYVPAAVAFAILSFRPGMMWGKWQLGYSFWGNASDMAKDEIDPRAIPYIQMFTLAQFLTVSRENVPSLPLFKKLLAVVKFDTRWDADDKELVGWAVAQYGLGKVAKIFLPAEEKDEYYKYLSTYPAERLYKLFGKDVFPDEIILKMIREKEAKKKKRLSED
jgi:hypothetical protein